MGDGAGDGSQLTAINPPPLRAALLEGANARSFVAAIFEAYADGRLVALVPPGAQSGPQRAVPGVEFTERRRFADEPGWIDIAQAPRTDDAPAQIVFSSGSTGAPKAILLSHRALADVVARLNAAMEVDASIAEYLGGPVSYSFGLARMRAVAAAGGRAYIPPQGFNPGEFARMLAAGEVNAVSAVPTMWRILFDNADLIGAHGRAVRWIEIGSQYMSRTEKERLKALFPNARILQHYGMTEASRTTFLDISASEGEALESVGRPVGGVAVDLTADGRIKIKGPHIADGVVTPYGLQPLTDDDGWLTSNDLGEIKDGLLYFRGRADDLINCGGVKVDPDRFEQDMLAHLGSTSAAKAIGVARQADASRGERVMVAIVAGAPVDESAVRRAAQAVAAAYGLTRGALVFQTVDALPRTATGKLRRAALSDLAAEPAAEAAAARDVETGEDATQLDAPGALSEDLADPAARAASMRRIWATALEVDTVADDQSFYDLGGDSLSAVTVMVRMERLGLDPSLAAGLFEGKTIAELSGLAEVRAAQPRGALDFPGAMNAIHAARGVLVAWVVAVHWAPGVLERIGPQAAQLYTTFDLAVRFGTPGFAIVFGFGLGALRAPQYLENPPRFARSIKQTLIILAAGLAALSIFRAGVLWTAGELGDPIALSRIFYSVLSAYVLIVASLGLVLRLVAGRSSAPPRGDLAARFALAAVAMLILHEIAYALFAGVPTSGAADLVRLLTTAKYGFFKMSAAVLVGAAVGWRYRRAHDAPGAIRTLALAGAASFGLGALLLLKAQDPAIRTLVPLVEPWHLLGYAGLATLILAGFAALNAAQPRGPARAMNRLAIAVGMLAFPIFIGHELVIPAKEILVAAGAPGAVALGAPMGLFGLALAWGLKKTWALFGR